MKTMSTRIPGIRLYWYNATRPALIKESMQYVSISYTTKIYLHLKFFKITLILDPSLVLYPQTIVCTANVHVSPPVGMSVQVTLVWLEVVGQLPQVDDLML